MRTYDSAREAAEDLTARGIPVDVPGDDAEPAEEWNRGERGWKRAGRPRAMTDAAAQRAKEKLQGFQRRADN